MFRSIAIALVCIAMWAAPAWAGNGPATSPAQDADAPTRSLERIGLELDGLPGLASADRIPALQRMLADVAALKDDGLDKERRAAARFLSAEIRFALGDYEKARDEYRDVIKQGRDSGIADDAEAAAIMALEAIGRDGDAAREWARWEERHPASPLLPEVRLARTWNALRRDEIAGASGMLDRLTGDAPWMTTDPRVALARATCAFLARRDAEAISLVTAGPMDDPETAPAATYLAAMVSAAIGESLKAAALFQQVADRFPGSGLTDHALLAKANIFLESGAFRSAAEEFERTVSRATRPEIRAEAELRQAAAIFLDGDPGLATELLTGAASRHHGTDVGGRAQFLLGEVLSSQGRCEEAILEYNRVLGDYFEHDLAASAQYRVGRCLDALGRELDATSTYEAVVSGHPLTPEAPAAAYLAGVGLLDQDRPLAAAPYFQLVLDRYTPDTDADVFDFTTPEHQELVEASLCLLELAYHRAGDLGQLSGMPHLMLQRMPPSRSRWRATALLIDADALAAQGRHEEARTILERVMEEFPDAGISVPAGRLLAWTYAQEGQDERAIAAEERLLRRFGDNGSAGQLATARLNQAHVRFNRKEYAAAAAAYEEFLQRFPDHPDRLLALYQAGLCYLRLDRNGDAADRWEAIVSENPTGEIADRAWTRMADVYFQAGEYADAQRCYEALLARGDGSQVAASSMLRLAQCQYNQGHDVEALDRFSDVIARFPGSGVAREAGRGIEMALFRLGQREDSEAVLVELVEQYPTSAFAADAQFEIATRLYQAERYPEAADAFRRVVSQFPGYAAADRAHFLMAECHERSGAEADARQGYEQFLVFFPESEIRTTAQFRLGTLRFASADYMRAAVDFTAVLDAEITTELRSASLYNLALCQRMLGQAGDAQATLERLRSEGDVEATRTAEIAYQLGDMHDTAGRLEQAVTEFERALAADPSSSMVAELSYRIGDCRERLGDADAALVAYRKSAVRGQAGDAFRLSALARCAAIYEEKGDLKAALAAYRDLIRDAEDPELVAAAEERVSQLKTVVR